MSRPRKPSVPARPKVGDYVTANVHGQERHAEIIGKEQDGKFTVFVPEGSTHQLTYREPGDYGPEGAGDTFRKK